MSCYDGGWDQRPEDEMEQEGWNAPSDAEWRGDLHTEDWPEILAGPEYWLYKKQRDKEEGQ